MSSGILERIRDKSLNKVEWYFDFFENGCGRLIPLYHDDIKFVKRIMKLIKVKDRVIHGGVSFPGIISNKENTLYAAIKKGSCGLYITVSSLEQLVVLKNKLNLTIKTSEVDQRIADKRRELKRLERIKRELEE